MNFEPVGTNANGEFYMKFNKPFTILERIQLLQRWVLVQSFCYYELNENCASDFKYDDNAKQLVELMKTHPEEAKRSRYNYIFHDYCPTDDNVHYTSGFDLLEHVRKSDKELYRYLHMDAVNAFYQKQMRGAAT